jgi:hypothetical protein
MVKKARILIPVCMAVVMGEAAIPAHAAVESYNVPYGSASNPLVVADGAYPLYTDFPAAINIPQFNPSQGTLTEIILTLSSTDIVGSEVYNSSSSPQTYSGAYANNLTVTISGPNSLQTSETLSAPGPYSGTAAPNSFTYAGSVSGVAAPSTTDLTSGFGSYTGTGSVPVSLSANTPVGTFGGSPSAGDVFFGGYADSYGSVEIEYIYTAVPEPGTLCAGVAALGFCLLRRPGRLLGFRE